MGKSDKRAEDRCIKNSPNRSNSDTNATAFCRIFSDTHKDTGTHNSRADSIWNVHHRKGIQGSQNRQEQTKHLPIFKLGYSYSDVHTVN